jgi:hypothetical protein
MIGHVEEETPLWAIPLASIFQTGIVKLGGSFGIRGLQWLVDAEAADQNRLPDESETRLLRDLGVLATVMSMPRLAFAAIQ